MIRPAVVLCLLLGACAGQPQPQQQPARTDALLPGSIGVLAAPGEGGLVVADLRTDGPAARAGVRAGDVLLRYNGAPLSSLREFNRRVLDTPPGSLVSLELLRKGERRLVEVPVGELDTMPRV